MLDSECPTCSLVNALQAPLALLLLERGNLLSVCPDQLQLETLRRLHSLQVQVGNEKLRTLTSRQTVSGGRQGMRKGAESGCKVDALMMRPSDQAASALLSSNDE